jgi:hypothetical protein
MGGDVTGIDIHNTDPKLFPEAVSGSYFQNLFTVVAKTDKLDS